MALDRTWYNSLVDDDGSGMTGSVWDKADVNSLMNAIDAEIARLDAPHQYVSVYLANSSGTNINNSAWQAIVYDTEQADAANMWNSGSNWAIVIPTTGVWLVSGGVFWVTNNVGYRGLRFMKQTTTTISPEVYIAPIPGVNTPQQIIFPMSFVAGDIVHMEAYQNSGAALRSGGFGFPQYTNFLRAQRLF